MYTFDPLILILATALYISSTSATIVLSQFQLVTNFTQPCQDAYDTPISGCDASDFPENCSEQCFSALVQAQFTINNACAGQHATVDTIIGQMFQGNGPQFMCTTNFNFNQGSSASSSSSSYHSHPTTLLSSSTTTLLSSSAAASSTVVTTTTITPTSSSTSKSTLSTSLTSHQTLTTSASRSTAPSLFSTLSSRSSSTTISTVSTAKPPGSKVFVTTAFNNGVATVLTSEAQRTSAASSNPDAFGGGGSPFEVGPNGNGGEGPGKAGADFWLLLSVIFGVALMR